MNTQTVNVILLLSVLAPMRMPMSVPTALSVVTMASTWGRLHVGPRILMNHAKAGRAIRASHLSTSYALSGRR